MVRCEVCNRMIVTNAKAIGEVRVCSDKCLARSSPVLRAEAAVAEDARAVAWQVHGGICGRCDGLGPIDARHAHRIWSLFYLTSWNSKTYICCKNCGRREQWKSLGFSALLGWWGLPWGLVYTPIQVFKNLRDIARPPDPAAPSAALEKLILDDMVQRYLAQEAAANGQSAPPIPEVPPLEGINIADLQAPIRPPIPAVPPATPRR